MEHVLLMVGEGELQEPEEEWAGRKPGGVGHPVSQEKQCRRKGKCVRNPEEVKCKEVRNGYSAVLF